MVAFFSSDPSMSKEAPVVVMPEVRGGGSRARTCVESSRAEISKDSLHAPNIFCSMVNL